MSIGSPLGGSNRVARVYRSCELEIIGFRLVFDLRVLNMVEFNVIFDMYWLSSHQAVMDCHKKK